MRDICELLAEAQHAAVAAALRTNKELSIAFIDEFEDLPDLTGKGSGLAVYDKKVGKRMFPDAMHLTADHHRLLAKALHEAIEEKLGVPLKPRVKAADDMLNAELLRKFKGEGDADKAGK